MSHPADLAADTAVQRIGPGRFGCTLPGHWDYLLPSGGVLTTVCLRAIAAELADPRESGEPGLRPLSATAIFCSPVAAGAIEVGVTILRRGKIATQARASLFAEGVLCLEVQATFGLDRSMVEVTMHHPPVVDDPQQLPTIDGVGQSFTPPFIRNFDHRRAIGSQWWRAEQWVPGDRSGYWYRYLRPQTLADGRVDPLCLPPLIDTMPPAFCAMVGPDAMGLLAPSLDLTVHFLADTRSEWLLTHAHCRDVRGGWATADIEIWDASRRLIAYGTQMMILRRRTSRPPPM